MLRSVIATSQDCTSIARRSLGLASLLALLAAPSLGCSTTTSFVKSDTTLGRVVVYRNGVAYFERSASIEGDSLTLAVPADKVDDFLKSLTVVDERTGDPAPIAFPTNAGSGSGLIDMKIGLPGPSPHQVRLSYVTEAPSWKPSYRVMIGNDGKVEIEAWAIVDNTSGEDWKNVRLGVGSSSAMSFRFDLRSIRTVQRETLHSDDLFAQAPPTGEVTFRNQGQVAQQRVIGELGDEALSFNEIEPASEAVAVSKRTYNKTTDSKPTTRAGAGKAGRAPARDTAASTGSFGGGGLALGNVGGEGERRNAQSQLDQMTQTLNAGQQQVLVEGYADKGDSDKFAASLERANRAREQLIRNGVDPNRIVAVGRGEQGGRAGGVRIVEQEAPPADNVGKDSKNEAQEAPESTDPIGTSHFESKTAMTVARGTSAMVSILKSATKGEVVYLYDAESVRGNASFPFRSVRLQNPTDSVLESGPVTVFGEGKFIGEGLSEPIPARSVAFIPFALDRQIQVERKSTISDAIARIITVQRGVFSTEVKHTKKTVLSLQNRMDKAATVYVRHTVPEGYTLTEGSKTKERVGNAYLFRVEVAPSGTTDLTIEEETPLFRTTDLRSSAGMELVAAYLSQAAVDGPLKEAVTALIALQKEMGNLEQRIATTREQMDEYRTRMDEIHAQLVTLKLVKTAGPLMRNLEKKLEEMSDKLSKATIDLVSHQEQLMVTRIRFQDGVAELSLEKKPEPEKPAAGSKS